MKEYDLNALDALWKKEGNPAVPPSEMFLKTICSLCKVTSYTRISDLAAALNIQPSAASKMAQKLAEAGFINYERYGLIILKKKGYHTGNSLLTRQYTVENFLKFLSIDEGTPGEAEKLEHTLSSKLLKELETFIRFLKSQPQITNDFKAYKARQDKS